METAEPLLQFGIAGAVLFWFMYRYDNTVKSLTKALNNNTKVMVYLIDAVSDCPTKSVTNGKRIRQDELAKLKEEVANAQ